MRMPALQVGARSSSWIHILKLLPSPKCKAIPRLSICVVVPHKTLLLILMPHFVLEFDLWLVPWHCNCIIPSVLGSSMDPFSSTWKKAAHLLIMRAFLFFWCVIFVNLQNQLLLEEIEDLQRKVRFDIFP
jgi:hypothetical protein